MIYLKTGVGIEIRQEDLLITCLRSNFAGGVFTGFARISGYCQRDRAEVRREIDAFFKREKINHENIVVGIPRRDVILRYLDLPKEVEDNLKQVIQYQVQSFEPTEAEKLYYDYVRLDTGPAAKKLQVLLVMMRKSILDAHLQIMHELGIRPTMVTAGPAALANMFLGTQSNGKGKTFVLVDLKPGSLELVLLRGQALVYAHEAVKQEDTSWKQLLLTELETAVGKVRLDPEETIESIVMAGESSESARQDIQEEVPGSEMMGSRLRFEMPVRNRAVLQEAATALGLAYSGITRRLPMRLNLLPYEHRVHQKRWAYIPTIILGLCIILALAGLGLRQIIQQRILLRKLDEESLALKPAVSRVQATRTQVEGLEKQIVFLEDLLGRRDMNLEILRELTGMLPADTYLKFYRNMDCTLTIQGDSSSPPDLIPKLEQSTFLRDVTQTGAVFKNIQTGKDTFTFSAKCER